MVSFYVYVIHSIMYNLRMGQQFVFKDQNNHVIMDIFTFNKKNNVYKFVEMGKCLDNLNVMMVTE